jgi:hypothetical protein
MCGKSLYQFPLEPIFPCAGLPIFSLAFFTTDHYCLVMELGPPIPDIPLWEPAAAVTPVTAVSTNVVSQVAQSVVEVSPLDFLPVPS